MAPKKKPRVSNHESGDEESSSKLDAPDDLAPAGGEDVERDLWAPEYRFCRRLSARQDAHRRLANTATRRFYLTESPPVLCCLHGGPAASGLECAIFHNARCSERRGFCGHVKALRSGNLETGG